MHGWSNHTVGMKSKKETIEIEIALTNKKNNSVQRLIEEGV